MTTVTIATTVIKYLETRHLTSDKQICCRVAAPWHHLPPDIEINPGWCQHIAGSQSTVTVFPHTGLCSVDPWYPDVGDERGGQGWQCHHKTWQGGDMGPALLRGDT